ncbi:uncharacterized protein LOC136087881 [Hydra vulgaris]|uniref:Uncharacterized protein LOC136087881 n=1 Tax=Hydra vulgaris TaxID=6087 RepID=A0ABM4D041_HYDVU
MSIRKGGLERAKELEKKMHDENKLLKKIPKINSFFTATNNVDATDNITLNSPPSSSTSQVGIDHKEEAAKIVFELGHTKKFEDRADTCSGTIPNDVASFGDITDHVRKTCLGKIHFRNLADSYPETKWEYSGVNRFLNSSVFKRVLPNGDIVDRGWLVYSLAKTCVFCFPCILFSSDRSQLSGSGFKDWKNVTQYLKSHEISAKNIQSVLTLCQRSVAAGRVDEQLHNNMLDQRNYWRNVLSRCVATIALLCERGLPLRGSNEVVSSRENGNYLGILELIGQFDPFLSQHICTHGNRGRGHTSYLSKTICEELIAMMGEQVMGFIKDEISKSRYFSVSVDSTPDITHCDQLTIILRYINMVDYQPVERFLTFINISSHTGQNLADILLQYLSDQDIDYKNCRGQTYDNASNMSASTHRWDVMMTHVKNQPACLVSKYPSDTRWSARADAAKAVFKGYHQLQSALQEISGDCNQNGSTRNEAGSLAKHMDTIEVALLCELWNDILQRFNINSKLLQSSIIELSPAIGLLKSLHIFLDECREKFDDYNQKADDRCGNSTYKSESRRQPKRKRQINDGDAADAMEGMSSQQNFKVNTFYVIIDQLKNALKKRIKAYSIVLQRFGVLTEYDSMTDEDIDIAVKGMVTVYSKDLCSDFPTDNLYADIKNRETMKKDQVHRIKLIQVLRRCLKCYTILVYIKHFQILK